MAYPRYPKTPSPMVLEYAQHYIKTGESQFEAFTSGQSCEVVELGGMRLRVSGYNHIITVEILPK